MWFSEHTSFSNAYWSLEISACMFLFCNYSSIFLFTFNFLSSSKFYWFILINFVTCTMVERWGTKMKGNTTLLLVLACLEFWRLWVVMKYISFPYGSIVDPCHSVATRNGIPRMHETEISYFLMFQVRKWLNR